MQRCDPRSPSAPHKPRQSQLTSLELHAHRLEQLLSDHGIAYREQLQQLQALPFRANTSASAPVASADDAASQQSNEFEDAENVLSAGNSTVVPSNATKVGPVLGATAKRQTMMTAHRSVMTSERPQDRHQSLYLAAKARRNQKASSQFF